GGGVGGRSSGGRGGESGELNPAPTSASERSELQPGVERRFPWHIQSGKKRRTGLSKSLARIGGTFSARGSPQSLHWQKKTDFFGADKCTYTHNTSCTSEMKYRGPE